MRRIRSGMGLGDSLYLQAVARHFVKRGESLEVCSAWPDVFRPLGDKVRIAPFSRERIQILAHYSLRKMRTDSNQFEDCCIQAGIKEPVEFRLDWQPLNHRLIAQIRSPWKPILCVQLPRNPMGRTDGFGRELLPDCTVIQTLIDKLKSRYYVIQIGAGDPLHQFTGIGLNLANKTSVSDLIDVAYASDLFLGYCSFMVPLAESLNKPAIFVWSRKGLKSRQPFISRITPQKILHRTSSRWVVDDQSTDEVLNGFL